MNRKLYHSQIVSFSW